MVPPPFSSPVRPPTPFSLVTALRLTQPVMAPPFIVPAIPPLAPAPLLLAVTLTDTAQFSTVVLVISTASPAALPPVTSPNRDRSRMTAPLHVTNSATLPEVLAVIWVMAWPAPSKVPLKLPEVPMPLHSRVPEVPSSLRRLMSFPRRTVLPENVSILSFTSCASPASCRAVVMVNAVPLSLYQEVSATWSHVFPVVLGTAVITSGASVLATVNFVLRRFRFVSGLLAPS